MSQTAVILWLRHDLRLSDHAVLESLARRGGPVIPVFILDETAEGEWPPGGASKWWLHHSLEKLDDDLKSLGSRLILRNGRTETELSRLADETGATAVHCHRRYEPAARKIERDVATRLTKDGVEFESFPGHLLFEPDDIRTQQDRPYQVFTPYWKACQKRASTIDAPLGKPRSLNVPSKWPRSEALSDLQLLPTIPWDREFGDVWTPGEAGAHARLSALRKSIADYPTERNRPDHEGSSRLSPHLHFGEINPRQVWKAVHKWIDDGVVTAAAASVFLAELGWREFTHHVLHHFPFTPKTALREEFRRFPWKHSQSYERAWQRGLTGYPIVDAGMRQLWRTGWMHNRVRMIVGSFLTKDLRHNWLDGARWFWDTLVDADLAQNTFNWQWVGGCGADAAPYFRVFNPTLQGKKFDPEGAYVRKWVPELVNCPTKWIHEPWAAPTADLAQAGITAGKDYPEPIVDHAEARDDALEALKSLKNR
ncbi:Deoxyribodipyrimidine photo-lyase [Caulifigura coniformis]|uniref:Deoxyribodipyrimidine photo-lyase n=1 Tax=Caulifigura coniformis TaxID=2527983 RepID=A0A517S8N6_9PLAN|nr:deoxyribodipyrimidine photo-lyase [Caulifigura coniformis]QDT52488.1 Deoxyribodipyrimidine photo-lyase [Caulifigura coniformis]